LRRSLTSLVAIALLALAILPSAADAYIYWGDTGGKIDRANLDGTAVNQSFIRRGYAEGVAVDALGPTAQPRISLEKDCEAFQDSGASSIDIRLTGFPPFTPFNGRLDLSDGFGYGPVHETTDASGNWESLGPVGSFSPVTWTVTVVWSEGTLTKSLYVDCSKVSVSVKNTALVVAAGPGAKDNLQITRPSRFTVRVTDFPSGAYTGSVVNAGAGCTRSGRYTANWPRLRDHPGSPGAGHLRESTRQGRQLERAPELPLRGWGRRPADRRHGQRHPEGGTGRRRDEGVGRERPPSGERWSL
jgi:hypothetical protein